MKRTQSIIIFIGVVLVTCDCSLGDFGPSAGQASISIPDIAQQLASAFGLAQIDLFSQNAVPGSIMQVNNGTLEQQICSKQQSVGDALLEPDSLYPNISINGISADQFVQKLSGAIGDHDQLLTGKLAEWKQEQRFTEVQSLAVYFNNAKVSSITQATVTAALMNNKRDPSCSQLLYNPPDLSKQAILMQVLIGDLTYSIGYVMGTSDATKQQIQGLMASELGTASGAATDVLIKGTQLHIGATISPAQR